MLPGEGTFASPQSPPGSWLRRCARRGAAMVGAFSSRQAGNGGTLPPRPVCKHFVRAGRCQYAEACFFAHPEGRDVEAARRAERRREAPNQKVANRGEGRRNHVKNDSRVSVLRRWLLDQFGLEHLRSRRGVLDVAGGKGELAWELVNLNGVPACVLEPRPLELSSCRKKWSRGLYWRNPIFHRWLHCGHDPSGPTSAPPHVRIMLESSVVAWAAGESEAGEAVFEGGRRRARALAWTRKGLREHEPDEAEPPAPAATARPPASEPAEPSSADEARPPGPEPAEPGSADEEAGDGLEVTSPLEAVELLRECSTVVALHPDQAAEPAVALALALGKAFAVVPCCVYAASFPRRRLRDGAQVRTYEDLLNYLQGFHPRIRRADLDFEGKRLRCC
ncbi:unnamed protein product [Prorocentrum cordatum]|uniref:C3H1-type domain-containing protein n=1 Tax=Prorocentrum cordatum TaxID=2364126 RepID=A0ABN9WYY6_9DINO|nr:unnamed protein product [Polarella glacialis]